MLDWANPGCLGTAKSFELKYGKPIKRGQSFDVTKRELATGRQSEFLSIELVAPYLKGQSHGRCYDIWPKFTKFII